MTREWLTMAEAQVGLQDGRTGGFVQPVKLLSREPARLEFFERAIERLIGPKLIAHVAFEKVIHLSMEFDVGFGSGKFPALTLLTSIRGRRSLSNAGTFGMARPVFALRRGVVGIEWN